MSLRIRGAMLIGGALVLFGACSSDPGAPATTGYTVDNLCERAVPKICAARQSCCQKTNVPYDQATCEANQRASCESTVNDIRAGKVTFAPANVDPCLAANQAFYDRCDVSFAALPDSFEGALACDAVFNGYVATGGGCERESQCANPTVGGNAGADCSDTTKTCTFVSFASAGERAVFSGTETVVCQKGLSVKIDLAKVSRGRVEGTCVTKIPEGASCASLLDCGVGQTYCKANVCTKVLAAGEACSTALDCASLQCTSGVCEPVAIAVSEKACRGE